MNENFHFMIEKKIRVDDESIAAYGVIHVDITDDEKLGEIFYYLGHQRVYGSWKCNNSAAAPSS